MLSRGNRKREQAISFYKRPPLHILSPTFRPQGAPSKGTCIWKCRFTIVCKIFAPREVANNELVANNVLAPIDFNSVDVSNCSACFSPQSQANFTFR